MIKQGKFLTHRLSMLEEMVHGEEDFVMTDSEFAFGWHFFVLSVKQITCSKISRNDGA